MAAIKAEKLLPASKSDGCQCHTIGVIISSQPSRPIIFRCFSVLKIVANILRFTLVVNNRSNEIKDFGKYITVLLNSPKFSSITVDLSHSHKSELVLPYRKQ